MFLHKDVSLSIEVIAVSEICAFTAPIEMIIYWGRLRIISKKKKKFNADIFN